MADRETLPCDTFTCWDESLATAERAELLRECLEEMRPECYPADEECDCAPDSWMVENAAHCNHWHIMRLPPQRRTDEELAAGVNETEQRWNDCLCEGAVDEAGNCLEATYRDRLRTRGFAVLMRQVERQNKRRCRLKQRMSQAWNFNPYRFRVTACIANQPILEEIALPKVTMPLAPCNSPTLTAQPAVDEDCPLEWDDISIL